MELLESLGCRSEVIPIEELKEWYEPFLSTSYNNHQVDLAGKRFSNDLFFVEYIGGGDFVIGLKGQNNTYIEFIICDKHRLEVSGFLRCLEIVLATTQFSESQQKNGET